MWPGPWRGRTRYSGQTASLWDLRKQNEKVRVSQTHSWNFSIRISLTGTRAPNFKVLHIISDSVPPWCFLTILGPEGEVPNYQMTSESLVNTLHAVQWLWLAELRPSRQLAATVHLGAEKLSHCCRTKCCSSYIIHLRAASNVSKSQINKFTTCYKNTLQQVSSSVTTVLCVCEVQHQNINKIRKVCFHVLPAAGMMG